MSVDTHILAAAAGAMLMVVGLALAPSNVTGSWRAAEVEPGEALEIAERRWMQVEVPADTTARTWLPTQNIAGGEGSLWFRLSCRGPRNLTLEDVSEHSGPLWVAAGSEPRKGPGCR